MAVAKLLDQESVVAEQVGRLLRACERGDRIGLEIVRGQLWCGLNLRCTNHVSDDEDGVFELRKCVWGKPLD